MKESIRWALGIGAFVGFIVILWYAVFSLTGMLWWNSEVTPTKALDPPKAPQIVFPDIPSLQIPHQMEEPVQLSDDPRLKEVKCECGCDIVLANCDCPFALKQIEELGIIKGGIE